MSDVLTLTPPWQDVPLAGSPLPEIELPSNCPGCGVSIDNEELAPHVYVYAELPPDFQTADFQLQHGQIDMVVPRFELRPLLAHLVDMYT